MDKRKDSIFPIYVSSVLVIITLVYTAIVFRAEARLFSSVFDGLILHFALYLISLLAVTWLLILIAESLGWHLGRCYQGMKWLLFFIYYPLGRILLLFFRKNRQDYQDAFLSFQNVLLIAQRPNEKIKNLLLILPHCLQFHECKIRITQDINACADCGDCDICHLKDIGKRYALKIGIANGGTLARKLVRDTQPDYIIAVACHRDLTDGVRESWHYPVYAILNDRPFGPCFNTKVDVLEVEKVISTVLKYSHHPDGV